MNFSFHGKDTLIEFTYSRLPAKCTNCRKWGHLTTACKKEVVQSAESTQEHSGASNNDETLENKKQRVDHSSATFSETVTLGKNVTVNSETETTANAETVEVVVQMENEWSTPTKVGRSPEKKSELEGHVSILSKSPFAVLASEEEEGEILVREEEEHENLEVVQLREATREKVQGKDAGITTRQSLPRLSKDNHKLLSNSTVQKTSDLGLSHLNKKSTRKNN
ncbi:hypothetical protein Bca101_008738 [Brassica carinata]